MTGGKPFCPQNLSFQASTQNRPNKQRRTLALPGTGFQDMICYSYYACCLNRQIQFTRPPISLRPFDQHRIAKAEKAITFFYRMPIRSPNIFDSAERGHEH